MVRNDVLVVEISGKRPGSCKERPTEKFYIEHPHVIISNNSEGYITDWDIVNVPEDYKKWYTGNMRQSENAWYAPMNRSYAIKYAKERGYRYLVQLDDNICDIGMRWYKKGNDDINIRYRAGASLTKDKGMVDDMIAYMAEVLDNTNAYMCGMGMNGKQPPGVNFLNEAYCYSFFMLKLADDLPDFFHGDFEDDIEYRLKLAQINRPAVQIGPFGYGKVGQNQKKDTSGCREEYIKAGVKRGEHMRHLYGDLYKCGIVEGKARNTTKQNVEAQRFEHRLKTFKIGVQIQNRKALEDDLRALLRKHKREETDRAIIKVKKKRGGVNAERQTKKGI